MVTHIQMRLSADWKAMEGKKLTQGQAKACLESLQPRASLGTADRVCHTRLGLEMLPDVHLVHKFLNKESNRAKSTLA